MFYYCICSPGRCVCCWSKKSRINTVQEQTLSFLRSYYRLEMAARELANLQHKLCPLFFTGTVKATRSPSEALRNAQTVQRYVLNDPSSSSPSNLSWVSAALTPEIGSLAWQWVGDRSWDVCLSCEVHSYGGGGDVAGRWMRKQMGQWLHFKAVASGGNNRRRLGCLQY